MSACAYCGKRAIHTDHVIPRSLAKKHPELPAELLATVRSCGPCNWLKLTRRLVPPSWSDRIDTLNELLPGTPWRVWTGGMLEPAYRDVHK